MAALKLDEYLRTTPAAAANREIDELLKAEEQAEANMAQQAAAPPQNGIKKIGEYESAWLKDLKNQPGYAILLAVLENLVQQYQHSATLHSHADPLSNKDALANAWAYVAMGRRIQAELIRAVDEAAARAK